MIVGALFFSLGWYAGVAAEESYVDRFSRLYAMEFVRSACGRRWVGNGVFILWVSLQYLAQNQLCYQ